MPSLHADVIIGFDQTIYQFQEDDRFALLRIRIIRGVLRIPVVVTFSLTDGTAIGEPEFCTNVALLTCITGFEKRAEDVMYRRCYVQFACSVQVQPRNEMGYGKLAMCASNNRFCFFFQNQFFVVLLCLSVVVVVVVFPQSCCLLLYSCIPV